MTDTLASSVSGSPARPFTEERTAPGGDAVAGPGCGCCKPPEPEPLAVADQIAELRARHSAVERRLRGLQGR